MRFAGALVLASSLAACGDNVPPATAAAMRPEHSSSMDPEVLAEVLGAGALDRADMSKEPIPLDRDL